MNLARFHELSASTPPFVSATLDVSRVDRAAEDDIDRRWRAVEEDLLAQGVPDDLVTRMRDQARTPTGRGGEWTLVLVGAADHVETFLVPGRPVRAESILGAGAPPHACGASARKPGQPRRRPDRPHRRGPGPLRTRPGSRRPRDGRGRPRRRPQGPHGWCFSGTPADARGGLLGTQRRGGCQGAGPAGRVAEGGPHPRDGRRQSGRTARAARVGRSGGATGTAGDRRPCSRDFADGRGRRGGRSLGGPPRRAGGGAHRPLHRTAEPPAGSRRWSRGSPGGARPRTGRPTVAR